MKTLKIGLMILGMVGMNSFAAERIPSLVCVSDDFAIQSFYGSTPTEANPVPEISFLDGVPQSAVWKFRQNSKVVTMISKGTPQGVILTFTLNSNQKFVVNFIRHANPQNYSAYLEEGCVRTEYVCSPNRKVDAAPGMSGSNGH